ncbi:hypothetical protein SLEP1_g22580 [Rubroshorea leprosula]|uniref:Uncharacterized protein n=1 Tax=Rubroshorea leprosula TaxID=152421 RepID=A0AAV5JEZ9_9ROSI|nr:hypothetical protein SLEP1_g22580 [Rubroshorea leprosula]
MWQLLSVQIFTNLLLNLTCVIAAMYIEFFCRKYGRIWQHFKHVFLA